MKKKEEILLEKLNMKDYKVEFEEILEQKNFSNDVKNFLLSLLYKIENSYEDYKLVKVISLTKQQFIEEYINIIKVECNYIELVKPMSKDIELLESIKCKCIAQKDKGKIVSIYNYKTFLYALYVLNYKSCNFNNEILDLSMNEWLKVGSSIEKEEVIRDFDGWSWHMDSREICSLEYNAIYQSVNFLLDSITGDLQSSLEEKYGQTNSKYLYSLICKVVLLIYVTNNPKEKRKIISKEEKLRSELDKISNKTQYLEQIRSKKKTLEDEIRKIDGILNDVDKLKKSYTAENKKLAENKKIFSISDYEELKVTYRSNLIKSIQECNSKMEPKNYLSLKNTLVESIELIEFIKIGELSVSIVKLQKAILLLLSERIKLYNSKKELVNAIYRFRYYKNIILNDGTLLKDNLELQESINKFEEILYAKASEVKAIEQLSVIPKINAQVLSNILDTKIIKLEDIELIFNPINYEINIKVNDDDDLDKELNYERIEGLIVKFNKKIKLFL